MAILVLIWIFFGILAAIVGSNRGGSGCLWFLAGFVLGPIGFLCAFLEGQKCPHCMSRIPNKATVCPRCQSQLADDDEDEDLLEE